MNDLRQRLHDALDDQHTDLTVLAAQAQRQGTRLRRRHRRTVAVGSLALAAVLSAGLASATQLLPSPGEAQPVTGFATQGEPTVPASGRSVTAALYSAVNDIADGTVDRIHGGMMVPMTDDGTGEQVAESVNGSFAFTPAGASSPGEVSASIYHKLQASNIWDMFVHETCPSDSVDCQHSTLPDGSDVLSYRWHGETENGDSAGGDTVVVERILGDVVVVVQASNGMHSPIMGGARLPNLPQAVLSTEQLKQIVSQPWWGLELPAEYSGDDLPSFDLYPGGDGHL